MNDNAFWVFMFTVLFLIATAMYNVYQLQERKIDFLERHGCTTVQIDES